MFSTELFIPTRNIIILLQKHVIKLFLFKDFYVREEGVVGVEMFGWAIY